MNLSEQEQDLMMKPIIQTGYLETSTNLGGSLLVFVVGSRSESLLSSCGFQSFNEEQVCLCPPGVTVSKYCKCPILSHLRQVCPDLRLVEASILHAAPHRVEALQINSTEAVCGH